MSKKLENPDQLQLSLFEDSRASCAQIFAFSAYRQCVDLLADSPGELKKAAEKEILERVLARAERLSWYK